MKNSFILSPFFLDEALPELESLTTPDWLINKPLLPGGDKQIRMSVIHRSLADFTAETITIGERPVSIAGDCCTAIGVFAGLQRAGINPTLIWFDAHGDFNTWQTSSSGFLGGMPLAMLVGRGEQTMMDAVGLKPISEAKVILTDARDLDAGERDLVAESEIIHLTNVEALLKNPFPEGALYVHYDTDIVSSQEVPAQNYPAQDGPSSQIVQSVFKRLAQSGKVAAVSLSSWNPKLDKNKQSEKISMELLQTLINL